MKSPSIEVQIRPRGPYARTVNHFPCFSTEVYSVQSSVCIVQWAVFSGQCVVCSMQRTSCSVHRAVCSLQCTLCSVLCDSYASYYRALKCVGRYTLTLTTGIRAVCGDFVESAQFGVQTSPGKGQGGAVQACKVGITWTVMLGKCS